jgi:anti-sigma regulatory factor (Ser/Thr protein kinase)
MCWTVEQALIPDLHAPHVARQLVDAGLHDSLPRAVREGVIDDARLVVTELVTNAVHAGSRTLSVVLQAHRRELRIEVTDDGAGWPERRTLTSSDSHGRGLFLVDALSDDWGVTNAGSGKSVWAILTMPADWASLTKCERALQHVSGYAIGT